MIDRRTYAWILLSVPNPPGPLEEIIARADWINHAIPTHEELQASLGWLRARGLVRKEGACFGTTDEGAQLLERNGRHTIMKTWDCVTEELESIGGADVAPMEEIPVRETTKACEAYHETWKTHYARKRRRRR